MPWPAETKKDMVRREREFHNSRGLNLDLFGRGQKPCYTVGRGETRTYHIPPLPCQEKHALNRKISTRSFTATSFSDFNNKIWRVIRRAFWHQRVACQPVCRAASVLSHQSIWLSSPPALPHSQIAQNIREADGHRRRGRCDLRPEGPVQKSGWNRGQPSWIKSSIFQKQTVQNNRRAVTQCGNTTKRDSHFISVWRKAYSYNQAQHGNTSIPKDISRHCDSL